MTWLLFSGSTYYPLPYGEDLAAVADSADVVRALADQAGGPYDDWQVFFEVEAGVAATERWTRHISGRPDTEPSPWVREVPRFIASVTSDFVSESIEWEEER